MNDCCKRNFMDKGRMLNSEIHKERIKFLKKFLNKSKKSIDIGSGGFMPKILNVSYACDVYDAREMLLSYGWNEEFKVADVSKKLPYKDNEFNKLVCSEVIEHLSSQKEVINAFREIDRISKEWIITTPFAYDNDPDHNFHFGYDKDVLFNFIPKEIDCLVIRKGYYYYISNSIDKLKKIFNIKNGK